MYLTLSINKFRTLKEKLQDFSTWALFLDIFGSKFLLGTVMNCPMIAQSQPVNLLFPHF